MRLARIEHGSERYLAEISDGFVRTLLRESDRPGIELIERYATGDRSNGGEEFPLTKVRLMAPLVRPSKIVCVGLNYYDHCREQGIEPPTVPILFPKFPNCIIGPGDAIVIDPDISKQVDFEAELAVVIGRRIRSVGPEEGLAAVLGYTVANDVSARDVQMEVSQWTRGKTFDTFLPLGPWITTADEVADPQKLRLNCSVNGTVYQNSSTAEMISPVRELVSFASRTMTLEPGDLILTGTPWGVGLFRQPPVFLGSGDMVRIEVERVGVLENNVVRGSR